MPVWEISSASPRFVGRTNEIRTLQRLLHDAHRGVTQFAVLFGRRRVGKSTLVRRFVAQQADTCRVVSFDATRESDTSQRERFHRALVDAGIEPRSSRWDDMLRAALAPADVATIIAIDEAPYLLEVNPGWASVLQHELDRARDVVRAPASLLILTGSAIAAMTHIISSGGALYERPTATIRLDPLDLPESHELLGRPAPTRTIEALAACGGYPLLLDRWDPEADAATNLEALAGDTFGALAANAATLLLELPDPSGHRRVLTAIGRGAHKLSEINSRAERSDRSLVTLEATGHIARRTPVGEPPRKNLRYEIADGYLRFWFNVVDRHQEFIDAGQGAIAMRLAEPLWRGVVADTFEREARRHAMRLVQAGQLPAMLIGEWWRDTGQQVQLDVVGVQARRWVFAAEVKWSAQFGLTALRQLEAGVEIGGHDVGQIQLASWSLGEPSAEVRRLRPSMLHFAPEDMVLSSRP